MNTLFRSRLLLVLAVLAPVILALQPANVDAQTRPPQRSPALTTEKEKMNAWTVGLSELVGTLQKCMKRHQSPLIEPYKAWMAGCCVPSMPTMP
jgi:hypothetical protein